MSIEPQQETSTSSPPTVVVEPEHEPETTRLEGIWHFILDYSVPLLLGILIALIFANASVDDYEYAFGKHHAWAFGGHPTLLGHEVNISFLVNDIFMVFFFGLATCEVVEAFLPGGSLDPPSKALNPVIACIGGVVGPVAMFFILASVFHAAGLFDDHSFGDIAKGWGIPTATDIALAWMVASQVFVSPTGGVHPAVNYLLLMAVIDDAIGLIIIAVFYTDPNHPPKPVWLLLLLPGMLISYGLRRCKCKYWAAYVFLGGIPCWIALIKAGVHPALTLIPVVPFMPDGFDQNVTPRSKVCHDPDADTEPEPTGTTLPLNDSGQAPNEAQNSIDTTSVEKFKNPAYLEVTELDGPVTADADEEPVVAASKGQLASSGIAEPPALGALGAMRPGTSNDPEELREMLKMVFEEIDENKDGKLHIAEIVHFMERLGHHEPELPEEARKEVQTIHGPEGDQISFDEFHRWFKRSKSWVVTDQLPVVDQVFDKAFREEVKLVGKRLRVTKRPRVNQLEFLHGEEIYRLQPEGHSGDHEEGPLHSFEHTCKTPVDLGLFMFSLCNAGVQFSEVGAMTACVLLSLIFGKMFGVVGFAKAAEATGRAPVPKGISDGDLWLVGLIASLGLTVALFVAGQAFTNKSLESQAKMGALLSGLVGFAALAIHWFRPKDAPAPESERTRRLNWHNSGDLVGI